MTGPVRTARGVQIRPTGSADLDGLGALFEDRFGHPVTREEWQWKYRRLPGEARSWVAVDDAGRVLAHAGALCLPARIGPGREAGIWQLTDWAGTAAVTGLRPPLVALGRRLLADLPRSGDAPWIFGFPSERHFRLGRRVFGYRPLPGIVELAGAIAAAESTGSPLDPSLAEAHEHCGGWPAAAEAAWEACRVRSVRRAAAFLNWRYHARPGRYYRFYRLRAAGSGTAGTTEGLAVFAFAGDEALAAELWLPPCEARLGAGAEAWLPALRAVAADLLAAGLTRWRFWPPPASREGRGAGACGAGAVLGRLGVRASGEARFMGCRGHAGTETAGHPSDPSFYYAMGDYDLV